MGVVRYYAVVLLGLSLLATPLVGQNKSRKVRSLERQRQEVQKRIASTDKQLKQIKHNAKEEESRLKLVRKQVADRKEVIHLLGEEVHALDGQLGQLSQEIGILQARERALKDQYVTALRAMQRGTGASDQLLFLLSSSTLQEAVQRQHFLRRYTGSIHHATIELQQTRSSIESKKQEIDRTRQEKSDLITLRDQEKKKLEAEEGRRQAQIKTLKGEEKKLQQELVRQHKQAEQLNNQIEAQIAKEIAEAERKAREAEERRKAKERAQAEAKRKASSTSAGQSGKEQSPHAKPQDSPSASEEATERKAVVKGGYAMDAAELKLSGNFQSNKGRLPLPVRGRYSIVRRFGLQQHSSHSRVQVSSRGIDIKAHTDRQVYAVFDGVVSRVFVTPGYGTTIILRHGNYLTVYSNLSSVSVSQGQKVGTGRVLGTISTSGEGDRAGSLHFQLWHERNKQNPELWLKK